MVVRLAGSWGRAGLRRPRARARRPRPVPRGAPPRPRSRSTSRCAGSPPTGSSRGTSGTPTPTAAPSTSGCSSGTARTSRTARTNGGRPGRWRGTACSVSGRSALSCPGASFAGMSDLRLELIIVPVTDVDRAKAFYVDKAGFNRRPRPAGQRRAAVRAAHAAGLGMLDRRRRGHHRRRGGFGQGAAARHRRHRGRARRLPRTRARSRARSRTSPWGRFVYFTDPDGNAWSVQGIVPDPGHVL